MALVMNVDKGGTPIAGDCTYQGYEGWINVDSMSFGVSRTTWDKAGSTERGGGKPEFGDVSISKTIDKSSPSLFELTTLGEPVTVTIMQIRSDEDEAEGKYNPVQTLVLKNALVSSLSCGVGSETPSNSESVTYNYTNIEWTFFPQLIGGGTEGSVAVGYDLKLGKPGTTGT